MKKLTKVLNVLIVVFIFVFFIGSNVVNIKATETKEDKIYYEDSILEQNELPGGIKHKRVKGFSKVTNTDANLIRPGSSEAGSANNKPLEFNKYYSQQVNVLEAPKNVKTKIIPWGIMKNGGWSLARVKDIAVDYEESHPGWKIVAGVNGDFFDIKGRFNLPYTSVGSMNADGEMYYLNTTWPMVGFNNSGNGPLLTGHMGYELQATENPVLAIYDKDDNIIKEIEVNYVNKTPGNNEIAVYFAIYDNTQKPLPIEATNAYVVEDAERTVAASEKSLYGKGVISKVNATHKVQNRQFAVVSNNKEINKLLGKNVKIRVQYEITNEDFKNCDSIIGFQSRVMKDGKPVYENNGYGIDRFPRNVVGVKKDGTFVMVVVDGRQPGKGFYGIATEETCAISEYYGMVDGYQMDGGGSATMIILKDGELQVVNSPSDTGGGSARTDSNGILVAMQIPKAEIGIKCTSDSIEFTIDVVEQQEHFKELYIEVDGKKKPIKDGKAKFTDLKSFKKYPYKLYSCEEGKYDLLPIQGIAQTDKITPIVEDLDIKIIKFKDDYRYEITCNIIDPDKAIAYGIFTIDGKNYNINNGRVIYSLSELNLQNVSDWEVKFKYNLQNNQGLKEIFIKDCKINLANGSAAIDAQYEKIINNITNIFN